MEPRRILCIAFPRLSSDRVLRALRWPVNTPLALVEMRHSAARVAALSPAASSAGLRPGMTLAQARAILTTLRDLPHDRAEDARTLSSLASRLGRFSPIVGHADGRSLVLDITGCGHLFGGERELAAAAAVAARSPGFHVRHAVAGSVGAARALANFGVNPERYCEPERDLEELTPLPPASLFPWAADDQDPAAKSFHRALEKLDALGVDTIGALLRLPRSSLTARVGPEVLLHLDRALGLVPEPVAPHRPAELPRARLAFAGSVDRLESIFACLDSLAEDLTTELESRRLGARELRCEFERPDAPSESFRVTFSEARRSPAWFVHVLRARAERMDLGSGVHAVELAVTAAEELPAAEPALFEGLDDGVKVRVSEDFRALLDRFTARLGHGAFGWVALRPDYRPDKSFTCSSQPPDAPAVPRNAPRPARLLTRAPSVGVEWNAAGFPVRLHWGGAWRRVVRTVGPEIVNTAWWDRPRRGEYFLVEREGGSCLWLFRDATTGQAVVEGVFH